LRIVDLDCGLSGVEMGSEIRLADVGDEQSLRSLARRLKQHPAYKLASPSFDVLKNSFPLALRIATSRFRHLPTTVIVGVKRAGTRRLYANLLTHPQCFAAVEKEIDYFSQHPDRSLAWYRSRFPLRRRIVRRGGQVLEVSPSYLPTPRALRRMKVVLPDARVIVVLRDPVSRAFAHYQHEKTRYVESRGFEEAVAEELRNNAIPAKRGVALAENAKPMLGYVSRGYYALQLEQLLKVYTRNRVLVIDAESMTDDMSAVCERVFDFMGLESFDVGSSKTTKGENYRETIDPRVAQRLREHFRPHDEMLQELLGQSFGWMEATAQAQTA
jgi:Sulfotransferase domain